MTVEATVYIVDDDPAIRQGLSMLVRSMRLRAEAFATAQEFLAQRRADQAGCLLVDVRMPGMSGLELLERLEDEGIHMPMIIISAHGDVPMAVRAMKAGALDFLEKPCRDQQLWEAIRDALKLDEDQRRRMTYRAKIQHRLARLSPGERQVLDRLLEGKSNKQIAEDLGLSVRTIEVRRSKVMRKMKAGSLAELVRLTVTAGEPCEATPSSG